MAIFTVYQARDGWRWRLTANNGRTVADCAEAYDSEYNAVRAAKRTKELAGEAHVRNLDGVALDASASGSRVDAV